MAPLLTLQDIHLSFGGNALLNGAELSLHEKERLCLVGRNGSGKSTLLKIAAGFIEPDDGVRFLQPGTKICYLPQEPDFSNADTALDYVVQQLSGEDQAHQGESFLDALGVARHAPTKTLSGGAARRVAIAGALAPSPDILLLDEPTNHLDVPAIEWLETMIASLSSAVILISHDRRFLETISRKCLWIDGGRTRELNKGFAHFEAWRDEVLELEELDAHKRDRKIVREEHWVRYGVTARRKRNQKRLRALNDLRAERRETAPRRATVRMENQVNETSGKIVIDAKGLTKSFGDNVIVKELDLRLSRGDKLGVVGANGAGKTTLIRLLTKAIEPDAGEVKTGSNLSMVTLDQARESLKPNWTLQDALTNGGGDMVEVNGKPRHVIGYMKDFLFEPAQARTPLDVLSGGERGRVMLARALSLPSNLMVLDEPTNDLDLETLDLLQELLSDYTGTLLLVSHDRDFIDRVVTSTLAFEGDASPTRWGEFTGGYSAMEGALRGSFAQSSNIDERDEKVPLKKTKGVSKSRTLNKLTYKDQYALETLPGEIELMEKEITALEVKISDPQLFSKDRQAFEETAAKLDELRKAHASAEESWLEIELKREALEGQDGQ